ncbi:MAG: response regulator [Candidatus Paceibacterota bacterium]|jgi:DNA-binding response OmpR family regulator
MDETVTPLEKPITPGSIASLIATPASEAGEKKFVLVIEDDKFLKELLVKKISKEGFDVQNAVDAESAFRAIEDRKPDIVLTDLILPGVDGFGILEHIKNDPLTKDVPVVILSNLGQQEDLDKGIALGATDYMIKANFTLDEIVAKVHSIIG